MKTSLSHRLLAHGAVYSLSQLANSSIGFLLLPLYARLIGTDGYGIISVLTTLGAFLGLLFAQGMQGAWFRLRFDARSQEDLRVFETTILWYLAATVSPTVLLLCLFGNWLMPRVAPGIPFYPLGFLTVIGAALWLVSSLYERKLQAEQHPFPFAVYSCFRTILTLVSIVYLVAVLKRGAQGRIEAGTISAGLTAVIAVYLLRPASPKHFSVATAKRCLGYGIPLLPHTLAVLANDLVDRLLVNGLLGLGMTGVYSMGYKVASLLTVAATAFNQAYVPLFTKALSDTHVLAGKGDCQQSRAQLRAIEKSGLAFVSGICCLSLYLTAVAREILLFIATEEFQESWEVVALVSSGTVAISCYYIFAQPMFYDYALVRFGILVSGSAILLNVAANLILIPLLGIMGSAWATFFSNTLMAALSLWFSRKSVKIPYRWTRWLGVLITTVAGLTVLFGVDSLLASPCGRLLWKVPLSIAGSFLVLRLGGFSARSLLAIISRDPSGEKALPSSNTEII